MLARLSKHLDRLSSSIAQVTRWFALMMVVITVVVVVMRYAFNIGGIALQESVMYLHAALFLLGIPYALKTGAHVRVDMFYNTLSAKRKTWVDLIGHVVFLLPISTLIFITSLPYVSASWRVFEGSSEVGGIPAVFLLKTLLPVMAVLLCLQGLSEIAKCIQSLAKSKP